MMDSLSLTEECCRAGGENIKLSTSSLACHPTVNTNSVFTTNCFISVSMFHVDWHRCVGDLKCYWPSCGCAKPLDSAEVQNFC